MHTIRGFDWIFYGDGTDSGQNSILNVECSPHSKSIQVEMREGCAAPVIQALQENDVLYAQTDCGLYCVRYVCSFKHLDATCLPKNLTKIKLKLVGIEFLEGVTTHDTALG